MPRPQKPSGGYMVKGGGGKGGMGKTNDPYSGTQINPTYAQSLQNPPAFQYQDVAQPQPYLDTRSHWLGLDFMPKMGQDNASMLNGQIGFGVNQQASLAPGQIDAFTKQQNVLTEAAKQRIANELATKLQTQPAFDTLAEQHNFNNSYAIQGLRPDAPMVESFAQKALAGNQAMTDQNMNSSIVSQAQRPYLSATTGNDAEAQNELSAQHLYNVGTDDYRKFNQAAELARLRMPIQQLQNAGDMEAGMGQVKFRPPLKLGDYTQDGASLQGPEQIHTMSGGFKDPKTGITMPGTEKPITTTTPPIYNRISASPQQWSMFDGQTQGADLYNGELVRPTPKGPAPAPQVTNPPVAPTKASVLTGENAQNPIAALNDVLAAHSGPNINEQTRQELLQQYSPLQSILDYWSGNSNKPDSIKHKALPFNKKKAATK